MQIFIAVYKAATMKNISFKSNELIYIGYELISFKKILSIT